MKVVRDLAGATAAFILMPVVIAGLGAATLLACMKPTPRCLANQALDESTAVS